MKERQTESRGMVSFRFLKKLEEIQDEQRDTFMGLTMKGNQMGVI